MLEMIYGSRPSNFDQTKLAHAQDAFLQLALLVDVSRPRAALDRELKFRILKSKSSTSKTLAVAAEPARTRAVRCTAFQLTEQSRTGIHVRQDS